MKITDIEFNRCSIGWKCRLDYKVQTRRQFTQECHYVHAGSQFLLIALIKALWIALGEKKYLQSLPGGFELR